MSKVTLQGVQKIDPNSHSSQLGGASDFNLEIRDKEFLALVGPVGAGKTALLRAIAGLEDIEKGDIFFGEKKVNEMEAGEREIAMISNEEALFEDRSVRENLAFGLNLRKVPTQELERRVKEAASILGIEPLLEKKPAELSSVDRHRTGLGRAMVRQPKVFLLDAPFSALPSAEQGQLRADLILIHERLQATILYATSDPMEALALSNRIAVINSGAIQQVDSPAKIYTRPANLFVAGYFGVPPMNLVKGSLKRVGDTLQFREAGEGSIECKIPDPASSAALGEYTGKEIVLGLRPEHIRPVAAEFPAKARIKGLVDLIEPRGAETLIHFQTGAHNLTALSYSFLDRGEAGHRMAFELDLAGASFFDPVSTLRIHPN